MTTVYVSGLYSGPSPSAGVGTARAIRAAFPDARVVGVDYWHGSSGLHHEVFDALWLLPSWEYLDRDTHTKEIRAPRRWCLFYFDSRSGDSLARRGHRRPRSLTGAQAEFPATYAQARAIANRASTVRGARDAAARAQGCRDLRVLSSPFVAVLAQGTVS